MKAVKRIVTLAVSAFVIWGASCILRLIHIADNMDGYISFGASALLFLWFVWSAVTASNIQKGKNTSDMVFRFDRFTSRLPDEFDRFCRKNGIGEREQFVEQAVIEKMGRYESDKMKREQAEMDAAEQLGITVERYRILQDDIRCNVGEHILRKEKAEQV